MFRKFLAIAITCGAALPVVAFEEAIIAGRRFQIPDGYALQPVAGPPLVERPITAAFDELGRLYVAESSGSNDPVEQQLEERPHRILRLEDTDGDGVFDARTVFADRMMFPAGTMWLDGSLYVTAPPSIWKLTDEDDDGVCDQREEWFDAKTLTGCANDLHGPYRGPDGWIYWCKGAFAEQTYDRPGKTPLVTRAAHIFRRHPDGGLIEPVMSGGMDNPVDVAFSPGGERFFTTTFLQHPGGGRRDGLIHAIYGGVYGKRHGVIDSHPRTGDLMPVMTHLGAAAPAGLARLESERLGMRNHLAATLFNMHKVTSHKLIPVGATFETQDSDLVVCDDVDFHPTDVIEDADGSLLIIDTGGWYKLCCPTSHLWKPDVLGAIYRLKRRGAVALVDPRGLEMSWNSLSTLQLADLLADDRPVVRRRASDQLAKLGGAAVESLGRILSESTSVEGRVLAVWTLGRIATPASLDLVRESLSDQHGDVRQAAIHTLSVHRDVASIDDLCHVLATDAPGNRRAAAEALGRMNDARATAPLLAAAGAADADDRVLEHSLAYALIEIGDEAEVRRGLASVRSGAQRAALVALDQMTPSRLAPSDVMMYLNSNDQRLRDSAAWICSHHADWSPILAEYVRGLAQGEASVDQLAKLQPLLAMIAEHDAGRSMLAELLSNRDTPDGAKRILLDAVAGSTIRSLPREWNEVLVHVLSANSDELLDEALVCFLAKPLQSVSTETRDRLSRVTDDNSHSSWRRLAALALMTSSGSAVEPARFAQVSAALAADQPEPVRSLAADVARKCRMDRQQCDTLLELLPEVGPLEIDRVVAALASADDVTAVRAIDQLPSAKAVQSLPEQRLREIFGDRGDDIRRRIDHLVHELSQRELQLRKDVIQLAEELPPGDVRRGQAVFNSEQTSCSACHQLGYLGGDIGPDLTRIGQIRTKHDLLESILLPNASFVRSYEPVTVVTVDGKVISGLIRNETASEVALVNSDRKELRIARQEIDSMSPSDVSIMPGGLEQQMTRQQLADLLAFLLAAG